MSTGDDIYLGTMRSTLERWFSDPDTVVGIFENHDLGSVYCGQRIGFPYTREVAAKLEVGRSRAPDTTRVIGWRYILVAKCDSVEAAVAAMGSAD